MFDLFSDYYAARDNRLSRIDARAKLAAAGFALVAVIFSRQPLFCVFFFVVSTVLLLAAGIPAKGVFFRAAPPMGMALAVFLLQSVIAGHTPSAAVDVFGVAVSIKEEGVRQGILTAARMCGAVGIFLLLSFTTPAHAVFGALRYFGVSGAWTEVASMMYRQLFVLIETTEDMYDAQKVRLGYAGAKRGLGSAGRLAGAVLISSIERSSRTHDAMKARGYSGTFPRVPLPPLEKPDYLFVGCTVGVTVVMWLITEHGL